jgi:hypothetical protein
MLPRRSRVWPAFFMYARAESMEFGSGHPQALNGHEQELDHAVGVRAHCRYVRLVRSDRGSGVDPNFETSS